MSDANDREWRFYLDEMIGLSKKSSRIPKAWIKMVSSPAG